MNNCICNCVKINVIIHNKICINIQRIINCFGGSSVKPKKLQTAGFVFTLIIGSLLHFAYEWSGGNTIIGLFGAVNESVWEHLKLLFVPMVVFGIFEYFVYGRKQINFIPVRVLSIILGMVLIISAFYTYSGIIGKNYFIIDILIFVASVYAAYRFSCKLLQTNKFTSPISKMLGIFGLILMIACFATFTFRPPHIALFRDPDTGSFGATISVIK